MPLLHGKGHEMDSNFESVPLMGDYSSDALRRRQAWVQERTGVDPSLAATPVPPEALKGNIENQIGFVQIPVGVAGPLLIHGEHAQGTFYVPMATTEGALVASCSRGCRAATESGGVKVRVVSDQMTRSPIFIFQSLSDSMAFADWIKTNTPEIQAVAQSQTKRGRLVSLTPVVLGDTVSLLFSYDTGDAYGANMVMKCNHAACLWINQRFPADTGHQALDWYVDSNMGSEKKVSFLSWVNSTRGKRVIAEVHLKRDVIKRVLKTTPEDLFEAYVAGITANGAAGIVGTNVNLANTVAAIFAATGQDIATLGESAVGQMNFRLLDDGVYFGILMPGMIVASVGGGTGLPSQKTYLDMIGCSGTGKARKLAEIVAATALCLDLSTWSAITADHFVDAHERLGRNRPLTGPLRSP